MCVWGGREGVGERFTGANLNFFIIDEVSKAKALDKADRK